MKRIGRLDDRSNPKLVNTNWWTMSLSNNKIRYWALMEDYRCECSLPSL